MPDDRQGTPEDGAFPGQTAGLPAPDSEPNPSQPAAPASASASASASFDPGGWRPPAGAAWPQPQTAWPQPQPAWPQPQPAWPQNYGGWPQQAWPPLAPAWPGYQPAWTGWQPPAYWPAAPQAFAPPAAAWPTGSVPWGYTNPPAVPPVLEQPGKFHPPVPKRRNLSLTGRASPRLYALGMLVGLPAFAALLAYMAAAMAGFKLSDIISPAWPILEVVCIAAAIGLIGLALAQGRQRRADGWQDYAGPSPALTVAAFLALVTALQLPLAIALKALAVDSNSGPATLSITLLYLGGYFGLVYLLTVRPGAMSWGDITRPKRLAPSPDDWGGSEPLLEGRRRPVAALANARARFSGSRVGDILVPLAMVVPLMLASNMMALGMMMLFGLKASDITGGEVIPVDVLSRILLFIAVAVIAPLGEELFFRGFVTNAWARSLSRNSTFLRASLIFAFIHVINTPTSDPGTFWRVALFNFGARVPVAFALTWVYMRRRSMLASGTLHAGYNGLITLISFL
jgi:membrane protease YdiL (CAAX protease family)